VRVALNGRNLRVEGDVSVPRANIAPRDFAGAVRASPDAVIVGPEAAAQERSLWQLDAQLRLALGADVEFHGFGLDADIGGSVVATDSSGSADDGTGELNVAGYLHGLRSPAHDRPGRLLFNGGLIDARRWTRARPPRRDAVGRVDVRGTRASRS
jgi:translocation and assembly module TamB